MSQQLPASAIQDPAILELPALPPPPGVIPDFTNPESKGESLIIARAILLTLVVTAVANRAYTKLCIIHKISWNDLTMSLSATGAIASFGVCVWGSVANTLSSTRTNKMIILEIRYGVLGKHQYNLHWSNLSRNSVAVVSVTPSLEYGTILIIFIAELRSPCGFLSNSLGHEIHICFILLTDFSTYEMAALHNILSELRPCCFYSFITKVRWDMGRNWIITTTPWFGRDDFCPRCGRYDSWYLAICFAIGPYLQITTS